MTEMRICPKAGECPNNQKEKQEQYNYSGHDRCIPHKENHLCSHGRDFVESGFKCPPCTPYTLQKGDRVRVTTKYDSSYMVDPMREYLGNEYEIRWIEDDMIYLKVGDVSYHWKAKDLEYIGKEDDMPEVKYKATTKSFQISAFYMDVVKSNCKEVFEHFGDLLWFLKALYLTDIILLDKLVEWAEKDPRRIKWLIDKGYIEEVRPEVLYRRGDRFRRTVPGEYCGKEYIIASPDNKMAMLINLHDGGRWMPQTEVNSVAEITQAEFTKFAGKGGWEKI